MLVKIYANHGVLGHEKQVVYSTAPADVHDVLTVEVPDAWETTMGDIAVKLGGKDYLLREVLRNSRDGAADPEKDTPALYWINDQGQHHTHLLKVISED